MQIPLMLLQLKRARNRMQTQCLVFFLLHVIKTYDQQPKVWFLFPAVFTPAEFKTYVSRCKSWKIHHFSLFWRGLILQVSQGALAPATGQPFRGDPVLRWPSAQCMHWLCSPMWLAPVSGQNVCFILRQTKPFEKHKAKWGVEVPVVSIYTWDVAIFCCTFGLLQRRKGGLGVS